MFVEYTLQLHGNKRFPRQELTDLLTLQNEKKDLEQGNE